MTSKTPDEETVVRRELEESLQFIHLMNMQIKTDVYVMKSRLDALVELLESGDAVNAHLLERHESKCRDAEYQRISEHALVHLEKTADKYTIESPEGLDCASRLHLCQARCCTYNVNLSAQDLDEGQLRWDYARPYALPQVDGYCTYSCRGEGGGCSQYEHRPAACRTYDCRNDDRIWIDFDSRIAAPMNTKTGESVSKK